MRCRVRQAFAGTAKLVPTAGTQTPPTTVAPTTTIPAASTTSDSGTSVGLWIAIGLVIAALAAAFYWMRSRRVA